MTARLDRRIYQKKIKVSNEEINQLNLQRRKMCPDWKYTVKPKTEFGK